MRITLKYDLRRAEASPVSRERLYAECLDQVAWADEAGFDGVAFLEHHGADDGYCPATTVLAAAAAARTRRMRIALRALVLPLHDPVRLAEELAVVDLVSGGRLDVVVGLGYRRAEYDRLGRDFHRRGRLLDEGIEVLKQAWTGEPFIYSGKEIRVTPTPVQKPRPAIFVGGASDAAALRAARLGDGYDPVPAAAATFDTYFTECLRLGRTPSERPRRVPSVVFLMVAEDPDEVWRTIRPFALHEANSYARWNAEASQVTDFHVTSEADADSLRGHYRVVTPDDCVALARELGPDGRLILHPLMSGLPPDVAWESLRLFQARVMPRLRDEKLLTKQL
jgi:alkanesulfonate monooxygenase SsuD/methylene tetrahydromethanopterin reductase-like flavin-dependent oxidoreductase (luciferase family)